MNASNGNRRKSWDHSGKKTTERGYGWRWQQLRAKIINRDRGMCQPCRKSGKITPATAVDHIRPKAKGGTDDPGNLQAICDECHDAKTIADSGGKPKKAISFDANGRPIW